MNPRSKMDLRRRSIYLLPNLFTTAALFAGFYAIVQSMNARYEIAAVGIFIAMVLDGLDGRVARMTHTQSEFGAQYDSLSDMVSFGVAPSILVYEWAFRDLGKWGWFAAFIYCAGGALRLARFNTNIDVVDKRYFQGLPSPAAAALVAGFVWVMLDNRFTGYELRWYAAALTVFAGLSMVSSLRYYSFKSINMRKSVPFIVIFLFALFFILVSVDPPLHLFLLFFGYCLSGYVMWLLGLRKPKSPPTLP
jgi:CDP-diacylglycerol--serine O-phosphatidyltransferase